MNHIPTADELYQQKKQLIAKHTITLIGTIIGAIIFAHFVYSQTNHQFGIELFVWAIAFSAISYFLYEKSIVIKIYPLCPANKEEHLEKIKNMHQYPELNLYIQEILKQRDYITIGELNFLNKKQLSIQYQKIKHN